MGYVDWSLKAVPWLRRSVAGLSPRRSGLNPEVSPCEFLVGKVALWQVSLPVLRFSLVIIIPPTFHTHLYLNITIIRRTSGRSLGTLRKRCLLCYQGACGLKSPLFFSDFKGLVVLAPYRPVVTVCTAWWCVRRSFAWFVWLSVHTAIFSPQLVLPLIAGCL
jgi:hypothetical protein